jgi:hypothetical protein
MNLKPLDDIFSIYIRLRDVYFLNGYCRCISCGKTVHWKDLDNGHFINRKHLSLRFNEINCNAQCRSCNRFDESNAEGYRRGLIQKHGPDIIDKLYALKNQTMKFSKFEMKAMIVHYTKEVKRLKAEKNL